jgi:NAD+ dependent glucose-6-phosphate dehydrogenase
MRVLLTGAHGRVGGGIKEHLAPKDDYEFTYLDREAHPDEATHVADVGNYDAIRPAFEDQDAVVHLAAYPHTDGTWDQIHENNIVGTQNVLEAASDAGVESVVFASSIHAAGMYEEDNAPAVYDRDHELTVTVEDPDRPDSYYGGSKAFGEDLGRLFVETREFPTRFYALRIASVRAPPFDNPYGDAERGVARGEWARGSDAYETQVKRLKGTWLSWRDLAQLVALCLQDETVTFERFFATSDNPRSWWDIEHAKDVLGYDPQDCGEDWTEPPANLVEHVDQIRGD